MQLIKQSLPQHSDHIYDVLVVGGGAAGLSAGIYLQRYLLSTLIVDKGKARSFWMQQLHNYLGLSPDTPGKDLLKQGKNHYLSLDGDYLNGYVEVDVSHRGGKPGFVRIDDDHTLTIPDFSGNNHFNTFGNLELNPHAGLLFIDFQQGDLLYLTGTATVIWEGEELQHYAGAERLLRFHLHWGDRVVGSLPLRWSEPEFSPFLEPLGSW